MLTFQQKVEFITNFGSIIKRAAEASVRLARNTEVTKKLSSNLWKALVGISVFEASILPAESGIFEQNGRKISRTNDMHNSYE